MKEPTALLIADLHLSHKPPECREGEKNWYEAMKRPLKELTGLSKKYDVPVLCAGDIFEHWKPPPELISFAIENLPDMAAIPGQHDLPLHNIEDLKKSAFWTLVKAGKIIIPETNKPLQVHGTHVWGFPFGCEIQKPKDNDKLNVCLAHKYVWVKDHKYRTAPEKGFLGRIENQLKGYNVAVFGDNHIPFTCTAKNGVKVWNCGSLMRRAIDQIDHTPRIGILMSDGSVDTHYVDISKDKITAKEEKEVNEEQREELREFLDMFDELEEDDLDYIEKIEEFLKPKDKDDPVTKILLEAIENAR